MERSMLAAVHDAASGAGEPEGGAQPRQRTNAIMAGVATLLGWIGNNGGDESGEEPAAAAQPPAQPAARAPAAAPVAAAPVPPATASRADPADVAKLCAEAGVPAMAETLIREGIAMDAATARVNAAGAIREAVALAAKASTAIDTKLADGYIAAGASIEHVRADLFSKMVAAQAPATNSNHAADAGKPEAASTALWAEAVQKVNAALAVKKG